MDEEVLEGGNVSHVVRVGDTVRRPTGPWTPAVHDLLGFLHDAGLSCIPTVHGIDDQGREILSHLPGTVIDVDDGRANDAQLASACHWLRRYHDTVAAHRPQGVVRWRFVTARLADDEIICHGDAAIYNMAFEADTLVGVFDWDVAGPGQPIDDLAFLAWNSIPLFRDVRPADAARRLAIMATAYGEVTPDAILGGVASRMTAACDRIAKGQAMGDSGMLSLAGVNEPGRTRARLETLAAIQPEIRTALDAKARSIRCAGQG